MRVTNPRWMLSIPHLRLRPRIGGWRGAMPGWRIRLFRKRPPLDWVFLLLLITEVFLCVLVYVQYVDPWITTGTGTRIGADSDYYWNHAATVGTADGEKLISLTGNLFGPVLMIRLLGSGFAILGCNVLLLMVAIKIAGTIPQVHAAAFGLLLLANGEMIPTIATVNKEIFVVLAAVLTAKYLYRPSLLLLLATLAASMVARWEQAAIFVLFLVLTRVVFRRHPVWMLLVVVAVITVVYPILFQVLGIDPHILDWLMEGETTARIDAIQRSYGFPLVVVPKIFLLLTGILHKPQFYGWEYWKAGFAADAQNFLFLPLDNLAISLAVPYAWLTGRLRLRNPVALLCVLTLVVTAVTPFTQPRYVFVVYVLLCVELARPRSCYRAGETPDGLEGATAPALRG